MIRTGGAGATQAEITDAEGATRLIPIRPAAESNTEAARLRPGSSALIYDYDSTGGFFVVSPLSKQANRAD